MAATVFNNRTRRIGNSHEKLYACPVARAYQVAAARDAELPAPHVRQSGEAVLPGDFDGCKVLHDFKDCAFGAGGVVPEFVDEFGVGEFEEALFLIGIVFGGSGGEVGEVGEEGAPGDGHDVEGVC